MQVGAFRWRNWLAGVRDGVVDFEFRISILDDIHLAGAVLAYRIF